MTLEEKVAIAGLLDEMGIDIIEAGFPNASEGDFRAVDEIAKRVRRATVCGLARCFDADIDRAGEALAGARDARIHTFIATSDLHMQYKLRMEREEVLERIDGAVRRARRFTDNVQWSPEDGTRTDHAFLCRAVETAIAAGATTINIPDTVGVSVPEETAAIIRMLRERVAGMDRVVISTHCHDDLGMAVANSLAAVAAGARQVECTINGLGERAGNAALEEVVMAMRVRSDKIPCHTGVDATKIVQISRLVSDATSFPVQYNKAIVGKNAFAHESGIHQDGMLKHAGTYEIMRPEDVGLTASNLVLGKHSGRAALKAKLLELGYDVGGNRLSDIFAKFKALADSKKRIFDDDLIALMQDAANVSGDERIRVVRLAVSCGSDAPRTARLALAVDGVSREFSAEGDGPVDAAFKAVDMAFPHDAKLLLYQVQAVTEGTDAQATVSVRMEEDGRIVVGHSADTDTVFASVKAYVGALNNLALRREKRRPQQPDQPSTEADVRARSRS